MPPHESDQAALARYPGFICFKSSGPIHYPRRWQRDALIQAALDPNVSSIDPLGPADWPRAAEFGFRVTIFQTVFACILIDANTRPESDLLGAPVLRLGRQALKSEPLCSTVRAVWSRKRLTINPVARYRAIDLASARIEGVPARVLLDAMSDIPGEPIDQLHAMLSQGLLVADLSRGLNGTTLLRPGSQFEPKSESNPVSRLREILSGP